MVVKTVSATEPVPVQVEAMPGGAICDVWLRKNIRQEETVGDDGGAAQCWAADELHFVSDGPMTVGEAQAGFDSLWSAHERDGMSVEDKISALEVENAALSAALAEQIEMNADTAMALIEVYEMVSGGGE